MRTVPKTRRGLPGGLAILLTAVLGLLGAVFAVAPTVPAGAATAAAVPAAAVPASALAGPAARADASTGPGDGYWEVASDGGLFAFGTAPFYGSMGGIPLNKPIVGMAATPDGGGYWEVASDGGIFNFGDAAFYGSTGGIPLNKPIVGMASTPDGGGYWLVAADGGIFAFGDAGFYGSTGSLHLAQPIVGIATTPDGKGYWLVAADGGIFAFGDATFYGSMGGIPLAQPVVGIATTPDGGGYWLVASDGGLFAFGDAGFYGSMGGQPLNKPIVGMSSTLDGTGYWEVASDGGLFAFGDAPFYGSTGGLPLVKPVVGMAVYSSGGEQITSASISGVSCPTTSWCQAIDGTGNVITYNNGVWSAPLKIAGSLTGISCPTTTFCMTVSYEDGYSIWNGATWSPIGGTPAGVGDDFHAVSCSSATFCAAEVDNFGDLAYYIHGTWTEPTVGNGFGIGQSSTPLSCVGSWCMYVNNYGNYQVTTGTSFGQSGTIPGQTDNLTSSVSCTSSTFCVAANTGSYSVAVWNGSGWTKTGTFVSSATINLGANAVSCNGALCGLVDDSNIYASLGGSSWTGAMYLDSHGEINALSCASATFCVTGDDNGWAYVVDPTAGQPL